MGKEKRYVRVKFVHKKFGLSGYEPYGTTYTFEISDTARLKKNVLYTAKGVRVNGEMVTYEPFVLVDFKKGEYDGPTVKLFNIQPYINSEIHGHIAGVWFNEKNGTTTVKWSEGVTTTVKCREGDVFDKEKGLALCVMKYASGNTGRFNNALKQWCEEEKEEDGEVDA